MSVLGQSFLDAFRSHGSLGDRAYFKGDYAQALFHYQLRSQRNPSDAWSRAQTARIYYMAGKKREALEWYLSVKDTALLNDNDMMQIGDALHATGKSSEAEKWFKAFRNSNPSDSRTAHKINSIKHKNKMLNDSLSYSISNLPINSEHDEFSPSVVGASFIFLSNRPVFQMVQHTTHESQAFLELYTVGAMGHKGEPALFSPKLSSRYHEGPYCFLKKGKQIIFTRTDAKTKQLNLYSAEFKNKEWTNIHKLHIVSNQYSSSHPYFSEEDSCLYFVSDMPGGIGGTDIYKSQLRHGKWGTPLNVGPSVNTEGNEMFPYVMQGVLYFASDGLMGLGGLDIYSYELNGTSMIKNLGYPINSGADDFGIYFKRFDVGYFCSNREGGKGKDDIYEFKAQFQPVRVKFSEVFNQAGIANVKVLFDNGSAVQTTFAGAKGEWLQNLQPGKSYKLTFEIPGYKTRDTTITMPAKPRREMSFGVRLERRNKVFIRGVVRRPDARPIPNCPVMILNTHNQESDQTLTNNDGEFFAEVDPDFSYSIVAENDTLLGWSLVKDLPKKRGAFVTVIDVISKPFVKPSMSISVKDQVTGFYLEEAEVEVKNHTTGEIQLKQTDKQGNCLLDLRNVFRYSIRTFCNDRESEIMPIEELQENKSITIILK